MPITISNDDSGITVKTKPAVVHPRYLILRDWAGDVGVVTATFDLKGIPPELHTLVINYLDQGSFVLNVGEQYRKRPPAGSVALTPELAPTGGELSETQEGKLSLLQKLTKMFRDG